MDGWWRLAIYFVVQFGLGGITDFRKYIIAVTPLVYVYLWRAERRGNRNGKSVEPWNIIILLRGTMGARVIFYLFLLRPHNYISLIFNDIKKYLLQ